MPEASYSELKTQRNQLLEACHAFCSVVALEPTEPIERFIAALKSAYDKGRIAIAAAEEAQ